MSYEDTTNDIFQFCTVRIDGLGQVECVRGGQIGVGRGDRQDEAGLLADELHDHVADLGLNVHGLVAHRDLGQARKINQRDVQHCSRLEEGNFGEGRRKKRKTTSSILESL